MRWTKLTNIVEFPTGVGELDLSEYAKNVDFILGDKYLCVSKTKVIGIKSKSPYSWLSSLANDFSRYDLQGFCV